MLTKQLHKNPSVKRTIVTKSFALTSILLTLFAYSLPNQVVAAVSSGSDYSIEIEDLNTSMPEPTSPPKVIQNQPNPLPLDVYTPPPYTIAATNDTFAIKITQTAIDFGTLSATNPVIRTSDLGMTTPFYGAQILSYTNHPLMNTEKTILPDTTCDTGTCSQTIPSIWENDLTYGFGYRCESVSKDICSKDFSASNSFKQLADNSAKESPQTIILNQQANQDILAKITYKVNISGTQPVGGYSNTITYIAVPNF